MFKKYSISFILSFLCFLNPVLAIDLDEATRTVAVDASGTTTVLSPEQVKRGKRLFNAT